jgi:hypothetical protein
MSLSFSASQAQLYREDDRIRSTDAPPSRLPGKSPQLTAAFKMLSPYREEEKT